MFLAGRKPKTTVFTMFFASGSKKHGIYSVFWPTPGKTLVFTEVSPCSKMSEKNKNTINYNVLRLLLGCVEGVEGGGWGGGGTKITSNFLKNQVTGLAALPFTS